MYENNYRLEKSCLRGVKEGLADGAFRFNILSGNMEESEKLSEELLNILDNPIDYFIYGARALEEFYHKHGLLPVAEFSGTDMNKNSYLPKISFPLIIGDDGYAVLLRNLFDQKQ